MTKSDLISRADAIGAVRKELVCDGTHETHDKVCRFIADVILPALPSAKGGDAEMLNEDFRPKYMQQCPTDGADLISRADAVNKIKRYKHRLEGKGQTYGFLLEEFEHQIPSAEPKTGEWVLKEHLWECDQCGCRINRANPLKGNIWNYNYCPNCGARMLREDGEA